MRCMLFCVLMVLIAACSSEKKTNKLSSIETKINLTELFVQGEFDSIIDLYNKGLVDTNSIDVNLLVADAAMEKEDYVASLNLYLNCLKKNKSNVKPWVKLGKVYLLQNDLQSAKRYFLQAKKLDPNNINMKIGLAAIARITGESAEAYKLLQEAIDFNPDLQSSYVTMAEWLFADKNELCLTYYNNALRIDSTDAALYTNRANAHREFVNYNESYRDYESALLLDSLYMPALIGLAYLQWSYGEPGVGLQYYEKALRLAPNDTDLLYGAALCYRDLGEKMKADHLFKRILEIDPNYQEAIEELNK